MTVSAPLSILDYRQPVEFQIGEVIIRSWNILSRHFLTFVLLVGIAELLPLVLTLYLGKLSTTPRGGAIAAGAISIFQFMVTSFAQAIVVFAAFQDLRGRPVDGMESFRAGVKRLVPVIVSSILVVLLVGIGSILCLAPGLVALAAMAVVLPACVVERLGPIESMSRSADLTTGHRWPILAVAVAWAVIVYVVFFAIQAAMPGAAELPVQLITWVWQLVAGSYMAVYTAILYHDLRAIRDGIGIDEIASVFD